MKSSFIDNEFGRSTMTSYDDIDIAATSINRRLNSPSRRPRPLTQPTRTLPPFKGGSSIRAQPMRLGSPRRLNTGIRSIRREVDQDILDDEIEAMERRDLETPRRLRSPRSLNTGIRSIKREIDEDIEATPLVADIERMDLEEDLLDTEIREDRINNTLRNNLRQRSLNLREREGLGQRADLNTRLSGRVNQLDNTLTSRDDADLIQRRSQRLNRTLQRNRLDPIVDVDADLIQSRSQRLNRTLERNRLDPIVDVDTDLIQSRSQRLNRTLERNRLDPIVDDIDADLIQSRSQRLNRTLERNRLDPMDDIDADLIQSRSQRLNRTLQRNNLEADRQLDLESEEVDFMDENEDVEFTEPIITGRPKTSRNVYQTRIKDAAKQSDRNVEAFFNRKPTLLYSNTIPSAWTLKFRLPGNTIISHKFNKQEPLESVLQQIKYDLKYDQGLVLILPPHQIITCPLNTPINACGIENFKTITVTKA